MVKDYGPKGCCGPAVVVILGCLSGVLYGLVELGRWAV